MIDMRSYLSLLNLPLVVEMSCNLTYLYHNLHGLLHHLNADKLMRTMEIATTCKDVRTWQTLERELCAIGSATDRLHLRSNTTLLHCLEHDVDDVHVTNS